MRLGYITRILVRLTFDKTLSVTCWNWKGMEDFDRFLSEVNLDELCCHTSTNEPLPAMSGPPCFAAPKSNEELQEARQNAKSKNIQIIPCVSLVQQECSKVELMSNLLCQEQDTEV